MTTPSPAERRRPDALDAVQIGATVTAQASLVASAQAARAARKSIKVRELRAALRETGVKGRSALTNKKAMLEALSHKGVRTVAGQSLNKAMGVANPVVLGGATVMSASAAYNAVREAGGSRTAAAGAGVVASAPTATGLVAPALLARVAPGAATTLSKFALPLMGVAAAAFALRGGYVAYKEGKGAGGIARGAALGAADSVTAGYATKLYTKMTAGGGTKAPVLPSQPQLPPPNPSANTTTAAGGDTTAVRLAQAAGQMNDAGLPASGRSQMIEDPAFLRREGDPRMGPREKRATQTMSDAAVAQGSVRYQRELIKGEQRGDPAASALMTGIREQRKAPTGGSGSVGRQSSLDSGQQRAFAEANTHFAASHMDNPASEGTGPTGVGWGNPATQAAAQEKRGVKNKTPWAKA